VARRDGVPPPLRRVRRAAWPCTLSTAPRRSSQRQAASAGCQRARRVARRLDPHPSAGRPCRRRRLRGHRSSQARLRAGRGGAQAVLEPFLPPKTLEATPRVPDWVVTPIQVTDTVRNLTPVIGAATVAQAAPRGTFPLGSAPPIEPPASQSMHNVVVPMVVPLCLSPLSLSLSLSLCLSLSAVSLPSCHTCSCA